MSRKERVLHFDFHCHIDLLPNPPAAISRCIRDGIVVLTMTTTPKAWPQNRQWAEQANSVHVATGLHPELIAERYDEVGLLEEQIAQSRFIGEVGLDGRVQYKVSYGRQREIFALILDAAQKLGRRVISVHSRSAAGDAISEIEKRTSPRNVLCILHWFTGSAVEARRAIAAGCFFSVNDAMLSHRRGRQLVQSISENRLLTETDSPFTMTGRDSSMPWDVIGTAAHLAQARGISVGDMNSILSENASTVLDFCLGTGPETEPCPGGHSDAGTHVRGAGRTGPDSAGWSTVVPQRLWV